MRPAALLPLKQTLRTRSWHFPNGCCKFRQGLRPWTVQNVGYLAGCELPTPNHHFSTTTPFSSRKRWIVHSRGTTHLFGSYQLSQKQFLRVEQHGNSCHNSKTGENVLLPLKVIDGHISVHLTIKFGECTLKIDQNVSKMISEDNCQSYKG